jgi:hypothetical protein
MDATKIFDAFERFSDQMARHQQERDEFDRAFRRSCPRCGSCNHWMKSRECPREHNVKGMSRGPSADASTCSKFDGTKDFLADVEKFRAMQQERKKV